MAASGRSLRWIPMGWMEVIRSGAALSRSKCSGQVREAGLTVPPGRNFSLPGEEGGGGVVILDFPGMAG
jgi:hypothetical protein